MDVTKTDARRMIGQIMRRARNERGLNAGPLASEAGTSKKNVNLIENGSAHLVELFTLTQVVETLNLSIEETLEVQLLHGIALDDIRPRRRRFPRRNHFPRRVVPSQAALARR